MDLTELKDTNQTGQGILNRKFQKQFRGYRPEDVDAFMLMTAKEVDDLIREKNRLADHCAELKAHNTNVQELENLLTRNLKAVADIHENAKFEAQGLIEESRAAAKETLKRAASESEHIRNKAKEDVQRMRVGLSSLKNTNERSIIAMLETLNAHYRLLDQEAIHLGLKIPQLRATEDEKIARPVQKTARDEELMGA